MLSSTEGGGQSYRAAQAPLSDHGQDRRAEPQEGVCRVAKAMVASIMTGPILAATDVSDGARLAVERARVLAAQTGLPVMMVHVVEEEDAVTDARKRLAGMAGSDEEVIVVVGQDASGVVEVAADRKASLIVVGAHGARPLRERGIGATSDRIVRLADCSVLVVKQRPRRAYRQVVIGIDGSGESLRAIRMARFLAPDAKLTGVHAFVVVGRTHLLWAGAEGPDLNALEARYASKARRLLETSLDGVDVAGVTATVAAGPPDQVLSETVRSLRAELVAVGSRGDDVVKRILLGSTVFHLLQDPPCDVMIHRAEQTAT